MAFDEKLAARLTKAMAQCAKPEDGAAETRMFGGFGYLVHGNMCVGIHNEELILRVGLEAAEKLLEEPHLRVMDLTGRAMKGWVTADPPAIASDKDLKRLCAAAVAFVRTLPPKK